MTEEDKTSFHLIYFENPLNLEVLPWLTTTCFGSVFFFFLFSFFTVCTTVLYSSALNQNTKPHQMTPLTSNCVSCAKAEQTNGSMAGKAAERQHWFFLFPSLFILCSFRRKVRKIWRLSLNPTRPNGFLSPHALPAFFLLFFAPEVLLSSAGSLWQH